MEAAATATAGAFCNSRVSRLSPSFSGNNIKHFPKKSGNHRTGSLKFGKQWKDKRGSATGCVALGSGSVPELEKKQPEAEMKATEEEEEEEEEWLEMGNLRGNKWCKEEREGMVELMECLEREAIMGDDEGKEPTDYNRRAQIFDKSSRVFQALKDRRGGGGTTTSNSVR